MRLLLVDDDRIIGDSLRQGLRLERHAVDRVCDAATHEAPAAEAVDRGDQ